jgi:hypothetical protein
VFVDVDSSCNAVNEFHLFGPFFWVEHGHQLPIYRCLLQFSTIAILEALYLMVCSKDMVDALSKNNPSGYPEGLSCDVLQGNVIFRDTIRENISYHQPQFG